jgi:hypothetical protein
VTDPTPPPADPAPAPPRPAPPSPAASSPDEPVSDRYRSYTPSEPAEIRRKLLFGAALVLAMVSVYAGLLDWGRPLQFGFAGLAAAVVLIALISGAAAPPGSTGARGGSRPASGPGPSPDPPA